MNLFQETIYDGHAQTLAIDAVLHQSRTPFQEALIFENRTFGRVLVLDGIVQLTQRDHHVYHEMIAHVPLLAHGTGIDVLIIGGGDGGALREVLKHPVRRAVLVELDADVIALSKRYFPEVSSGAFNDARTRVLVQDAAAYVAQADEKFDVIIIDSTDPIGPGEALFSDAFYRACKRLLRPGGVVSMQSGAPYFLPDELETVRRRLAACFGFAQPFLAPVPTYAHGLLPLILAGQHAEALFPGAPLLRARFARIRAATRYYSPEVHEAAFALAPSFADLTSVSAGSDPSRRIVDPVLWEPPA